MKKTLAVLCFAVLAFASAGTALAFEGRDRGGNSEGKLELFGDASLRLGEGHASVDTRVDAEAKLELRKHWPENGFVYSGIVKSVSGDSFVMTVDHSVKNENNGKDITIKTNSNTKIMVLGDGKQSGAFADIKVGATVWAAGKIDGSVNTASWVHVKGEKAQKRKVVGEVTAKTDSSITIKNNVSGQTTTVPVNDDTKVAINGEAKTMADVQVGDKGMVKIKTVLNVAVAKFVHLFR